MRIQTALKIDICRKIDLFLKLIIRQVYLLVNINKKRSVIYVKKAIEN